MLYRISLGLMLIAAAGCQTKGAGDGRALGTGGGEPSAATKMEPQSDAAADELDEQQLAQAEAETMGPLKESFRKLATAAQGAASEYLATDPRRNDPEPPGEHDEGFFQAVEEMAGTPPRQLAIRIAGPGFDQSTAQAAAAVAQHHPQRGAASKAEASDEGPNYTRLVVVGAALLTAGGLGACAFYAAKKGRTNRAGLLGAAAIVVAGVGWVVNATMSLAETPRQRLMSRLGRIGEIRNRLVTRLREEGLYQESLSLCGGGSIVRKHSMRSANSKSLSGMSETGDSSRSGLPGLTSPSRVESTSSPQTLVAKSPKSQLGSRTSSQVGSSDFQQSVIISSPPPVQIKVGKQKGPPESPTSPSSSRSTTISDMPELIALQPKAKPKSVAVQPKVATLSSPREVTVAILEAASKWSRKTIKTHDGRTFLMDETGLTIYAKPPADTQVWSRIQSWQVRGIKSTDKLEHVHVTRSGTTIVIDRAGQTINFQIPRS